MGSCAGCWPSFGIFIAAALQHPLFEESCSVKLTRRGSRGSRSTAARSTREAIWSSGSLSRTDHHRKTTVPIKVNEDRFCPRAMPSEAGLRYRLAAESTPGIVYVWS